MKLSWLHCSDVHFKAGDTYDQDVVTKAFVRSVRWYREERGRKPDLIFFTGDVGYSGKAAEYEKATRFFDDLLDAADLERNRLFVVAGNHDVDRDAGEYLKRTLSDEGDSNRYFAPETKKLHLEDKLAAYGEWYNSYFSGIRSHPIDTTCAPVEIAEIDGARVAILLLNSAPFCQDDSDHRKLWLGNRCLSMALEQLQEQKADLHLGLIHHPLDWLHWGEKEKIAGKLENHLDVLLHGHLHEQGVQSTVSASGEWITFSAGATYQGSQWPQRALYGSIEGPEVRVFPIRYENGKEIWTVDPSLFPKEAGYEGSFQVAGLAPSPVTNTTEPEDSFLQKQAGVTLQAEAPLTNIPARRNLPFLGRDELLDEIQELLPKPGEEGHLVLWGHAGSGKTELAREFARRSATRYPGGTFVIDGSSADAKTRPSDLAELGRFYLGLEVKEGTPLQDQCQMALIQLWKRPSLLIIDNVEQGEDVEPWMPVAGAACHVLITSTWQGWKPSWNTREVPRLTDETCLQLVEAIGGAEVTEKFGQELVSQAGGLPIQICPQAMSLRGEQQRGRLEQAEIKVGLEATESFTGVFDRLDEAAQLLLLAAAQLNPQRILEEELWRQLEEGGGWEKQTFDQAVDHCWDLTLLDLAVTERAEGRVLRMHQLVATDCRARRIPDTLAKEFNSLLKVQGRCFVEVAKQLKESPADARLASRFNSYELKLDYWLQRLPELSPSTDFEPVGEALSETGRFADAGQWFRSLVGFLEGIDDAEPETKGRCLRALGNCFSEQGDFIQAREIFKNAVDSSSQGDVHGRVDHSSVGLSLHQVGSCLSSLGEFSEAQGWYERAVESSSQGDVHGRVDHESVGSSLHDVGYCLSSLGEFSEARGWFERAVESSSQGDVHGRVDYSSVGRSLHQVGYCLSSLGEFSEARGWFERAVESSSQGDIHGRVDYSSVGRSLHQVGYCLSSLGEFSGARGWYKRAVESKLQGDVHGRVDYSSVGLSRALIGMDWVREMNFEQALPFFESGIGELRQGDIFRRVDSFELTSALRIGAQCLRHLGETERAEQWESEAQELDP